MLICFPPLKCSPKHLVDNLVNWMVSLLCLANLTYYLKARCLNTNKKVEGGENAPKKVEGVKMHLHKIHNVVYVFKFPGLNVPR